MALVVFASFLYFLVFTAYSIQRLNMLWASYFDLGIMHQTVWNTYKAIQALDLSRFLMLTDPHGSGEQIYRMAIHADYFLAILSPLYFIHSGPETLLLFQTLALACGAIAIYFITSVILRKQHSHAELVSASKKKIPDQVLDDSHMKMLTVVFPLIYLMNFAVQRTNYYEFHAVTIATPLILFMYAAYLYKKYWLAALLAILAISTKEQVGFSIGVLLFVESLKYYYHNTNLHYFWNKTCHPACPDYIGENAKLCSGSLWQKMLNRVQHDTQLHRFSILFVMSAFSFLYVFVTIFYIMPAFRSGDEHFALSYFIGDKSEGLFQNIPSYFLRLFSLESLKYITYMFGALAFLPLLSIYSLPAIPDLLINILSESGNMRNFYYHYTAVITPWLFISLIYSTKNILRKWNSTLVFYFYIFLLLFCSLYFSYLESPLPYSLRGGAVSLTKTAGELKDIRLWQQVLADDGIPVASTGQLSPYLSGRTYFYDFDANYTKAKYILIRRNEVYNYSDKHKLIPVYERLVSDVNYQKVYVRGLFEVYKRVSNL